MAELSNLYPPGRLVHHVWGGLQLSLHQVSYLLLAARLLGDQLLQEGGERVNKLLNIAKFCQWEVHWKLYKEIWYNEIPNITNKIVQSQWNQLFCFV